MKRGVSDYELRPECCILVQLGRYVSEVFLLFMLMRTLVCSQPVVARLSDHKTLTPVAGLRKENWVAVFSF